MFEITIEDHVYFMFVNNKCKLPVFSLLICFVDTFFRNISHYDWERLAEVDFTLDTAITMSTELFAMEIANRVITCFYEVCLTLCCIVKGSFV